MEQATKLKVYAKLNLALDITGTDGDGYHLLDMINCTVGVADTLTVSRAKSVRVVMGGAECGAENTAHKAAIKIAEASGVALHVEIAKGIPISAGMGGSSADAAAVLRYAFDAGIVTAEQARAAAMTVGSDVVYMMRGGLCRIGGRGEVVHGLTERKLTLAIVRDAVGASTAQVYRRFDAIGERGVGIDAVLAGSAARYNVLELPAISLCPSIAVLKERMRRAFGEAVMTGSGSAVCSIVDDEREAKEILRRDFAHCAFAQVVATQDEAIRYL